MRFGQLAGRLQNFQPATSLRHQARLHASGTVVSRAAYVPTAHPHNGNLGATQDSRCVGCAGGTHAARDVDRAARREGAPGGAGKWPAGNSGGGLPVARISFRQSEEKITPLLKNSLEHIHLLGIGGAAMAPVAGMLKERGYTVTGSDANVYPPASTLLSSLAIPWKEGFRAENLQPAPDLIVVGNAISRGNPELEAALDARIPYWSMPQTLEELFLPGHTPIVVAGTHGKTTTTAMLAWIFHSAGRRPDFLVGGVVPNFGERSYGLGGGEEFIIEGDEYDSAYFDKQPKFLHYHPEQLILTSLEFDHADIYPDLASIELQFRRLVNLVPRCGKIMVWGEAANLVACTSKAFCPVETYGLAPDLDWCAGDIEWREGMTHFRAVHQGKEVRAHSHAARGQAQRDECAGMRGHGARARG